MKDQYFGDINDFRKYGLLRRLVASNDLRIGICWMLTAPDLRPDGGRLEYLTSPARYRLADPELFDWMVEVVRNQKDRRTKRIEATNLLGAAVFHSAVLGDSRTDREKWFAECRDKFSNCDLVFFDPTTASNAPYSMADLDPAGFSIGPRFAKCSPKARRF